jgi:hypothetical protein
MKKRCGCHAQGGKCKREMAVSFAVRVEKGFVYFAFCEGHLWLVAKLMKKLQGKVKLPMLPPEQTTNKEKV